MNSVWVVSDIFGITKGVGNGQIAAWYSAGFHSGDSRQQKIIDGWTCREYVPAEQYDATLKDKQRQIDHLVECLEEVVGHANDVLETFYLPRPPEPGSVQDAPPKEFVQ